MTDLMQLAEKAYKAQVQEAKEARLMRLNELTTKGKAAATKRFGLEPERLEPGYVIYHDNDGNPIRLKVKEEEYRIEFHLEGNCPACGRRVDSRRINSLSDLYEMTVSFSPDYYHHCYSDEVIPDAPERAVSVLDAISQSLATIAAAMQPAPVAEKRPSVVEIGDTIINLAHICYVGILADDSVKLRFIDGSAFDFQGPLTAQLLTAYRAYCGLEPQAEQADFQNRIFDAIKAAGANEVEAIKEASRYHQF